MCGRFVQKAKAAEIADRFKVSPPAEASLTPRYNLAPTQPAAVIRVQNSKRILDACSWGLVPGWAKDTSLAAKMINARAETLWEKASFRNAIRYRRCLIPANGFYEWRVQRPSGPTARPIKQPYYFEVEHQELFAFAGLWEVWSDRDGGELFTFSIVTRPANDWMQEYHHRMPVILAPKDEALWLDHTCYREADIAPLLQAAPPPLTARPVSRRVNSVANDDPELLAPLTPRPQQGEFQL